MKRAFTLIELLVVIAIIAILAAILFPVFAQAKLAAKKSVGVAHTKQMALSTMMYSTDYDDIFPLAYNYPSTGAAGGFPWSLSVFPYTKSYDMFLSPLGAPNPVPDNDWKYIWAYGTIPRAAIKKLPYYTAGDWPITRALGVVNVRYDSIMGWGQAGNVWGCWGSYCSLWDGAITVPSKSQTELADVANAALIFDAGEPFADHVTFVPGQELGVCVDRGSTYNPGDHSIAGATPRWGGPTSCKGWRNPGSGGISMENANKLKTGQANIAFADGHVKSMGLTELYKHEACASDPNQRCMVRFRPE